MPLRLNPLDGPCGVSVTGLDPAKPPAHADADVLRSALAQHKLLVLRGCALDEPAQLAFAAIFGPRFSPPSDQPVLGPPLPASKRVSVSNLPPHGLLGAGSLASHSDHAFLASPSVGSVLHAAKIPTRGGDTSWTDLELALATLDDELRAGLSSLRVWAFNPWAGAEALRVTGGVGQRYSDVEAPRVLHALVRPHPITGRESLNISMLSAGIVDAEHRDVDRALLRKLQRHVERPELAYSHRWSVGDVIVFDNRSTCHRRTAFDPAQARLLYRVEFAASLPC